jgi:NitT/TauT family transport system substrate-binding protein
VNCCQETKTDLTSAMTNEGVSRRGLLLGAAGLAGAAVAGRAGTVRAQQPIKLAFCSQLLCVVPYEVTQAQRFFEREGLDVELVYTRGGNAAMQALVGGAVDYAATSFDVAVQAFANGAPIRRFATTGRLPLFALAVGPSQTDEITSIADLQGKTVGVSGLGNADHTMLLFLLAQSGADASQVEFATLGPNLFDALRVGHVDAGMVQEPALSLIVEQGGKVLFNAMNIEDAEQHLGGAYEFMGVAVRAEERDQRLEEMRALARALDAGLDYLRDAPIEEVRSALPPELLVGGDGDRFDEIITRYRGSLYPETVAIDRSAAERVIKSLTMSGVLQQEVDLGQLLDTEVVPS